MAYKVYISTNQTPESKKYLSVIKQALSRIGEIPITAEDLLSVKALTHSLTDVYGQIDESNIFIGLYSASYGYVPDGDTQSIAEQEYHYAVMQNKAIMVFLPDDALETADERQQTFLHHVRERHIAHYFTNRIDLGAKVKLTLASYKETSATIQNVKGSITPSPTRNFIPQHPQKRDEEDKVDKVGETDFEAQVTRAVQIAQDDLEQIVRRALELHQAQSQLESEAVAGEYIEDERDGLVLARPIWGEPLRRSQFQSDIFMIMPFRERFTNVYENVIRPVVAGLNLTMRRGDDFSSTRGSIMAEVWAAIYACKLVIVETTEINANVYYELGIAHALGKPAILLTQTTEVEQLPFDIRHLRFLVYEDSIAGSEKLEADLGKSIIWIMNDIREQEDS